MNQEHYKYSTLSPLDRIAEIERIRATYPAEHRQVVRMDEQIEEIKRKEGLNGD